MRDEKVVHQLGCIRLVEDAERGYAVEAKSKSDWLDLNRNRTAFFWLCERLTRLAAALNSVEHNLAMCRDKRDALAGELKLTEKNVEVYADLYREAHRHR